MTNLSDLLPAGAASKQLSFTASGTIANGQTVGLNSDGTVSIIQGNGSVVEYEDGSVRGQTAAGVFDTTNNKVIVSYTDSGDSNKGKAVVGTVSGLTISFGTPVEFHPGQTYYGGISFDTNAGKCLIVWLDGDINYVQARVGTVSGTSISFGNFATITTNYAPFPAVAYDANAQKHLITYRDDSQSSAGYAKVATISGTDVTFGSETQFESGRADAGQIAYDANAQKLVVSYYDVGNSSYGTSVVGTISGTSVSFGTPVVFASATTSYLSTAYDANAQKVVIAFNDQADSYLPKAIVGTVSGTSISFGSEASLGTVSVNGSPSVAYNPDTQKHTIVWGNQSSPYQVYQVTATVSGTSISATSAVIIYDETNGASPEPRSLVYDTNSDRMVLQMREGTSDDGIALVLNPSFVPASSFLGIADAAISNAASGKITMKGGIATNSQLLPLAYTGSLGSAAVYQSTATEYQGIAFDSSNNKVVVAYKNDSNAQGTVAVGTVSGTSITWGTPVVFATASTSYCDVVFDSSNNKVVVVYSDVANSEYGTAIVGTVSGTSISFGSEVVFASAATTYIRAAFDSNENKVVVAYRDDGNSQYGTAIVGNVSGTSISFGTEVVFDSTGALSAAFGGFVFDSTNNKIVIPYTRSVSHCIVGTVSGTSISFGTKVDFGGTISGQNLSVAFDSNAGKVVINYRDSNNSDYFGSLVGTVSGTSISFGTELVIEEVHNQGTAAFDSNSNVIVYSYRDNSASAGYYRIGTVSGTSISYGSAAAITSSNPYYMVSTFDSNQNTVVVAYKDVANSNYGTARGVQVSGAYPNLVPNSTYYVQDDGTLSTTSSSVTAGKAMSTNSINLDYSS